MGFEEYVDLDVDEFQRRSTERLLALIERCRSDIERDLATSFVVRQVNGNVELTVDGQPVYVASAMANGRLVLTDVSGRFRGRL